MNELTINEAIALSNELSRRISDLSSLRNQVSTKTSFMYGDDSKKVVEPQYDVKLVDKKISELQNAKYKLDAKIKAVNAVTKLSGHEVDVDALLAPLQ